MALTKKSEDISAWYNEVIEKAGLAEHGPVRGTMIIKPLGYALWENIQKNMDTFIKGFGVDNCYFPLFIPLSFLQKEKSHVEGFSPELAVVTHGGGEKLSEAVVVRPTSETIMYDAFSRWVQSFRDLPLKINQWCNVVRWEKRPYLFLRGTEFLWQEGHTAHADLEGAEKMQQEALQMYQDFYQNYLGIFGIAGKKSEAEKFAGADSSFTYEILSPDGKVIQGCTSHNLGQNFAKVFDIQFQDKDLKRKYVYQTSWGFSTRSLGALVLAHGDDNGLILPPQIAPTQVIILPIINQTGDKEVEEMAKKAYQLLESYNLRVKMDLSDNSIGWKFNQYELQGVPLRIEIGQKEAQNKEYKLVLRDKSEAKYVKLNELAQTVEELLQAFQKSLLHKSKTFTLENTREAKTYEEFKKIMETKKGFIEAFWCERSECEEKIKEETKASTRCLPFNSIKGKGECVYCQKKAENRWLFAQSY